MTSIDDELRGGPALFFGLFLLDLFVLLFVLDAKDHRVSAFGIDRHPPGIEQCFLWFFTLIGERVSRFPAVSPMIGAGLPSLFSLAETSLPPVEFERVQLAGRLFFGVEREVFPSSA